YRYDINGKLATQTDGNGNTTIYSYDDADQLVAVTDPLGYSTTYSYTLTGQVEKILRPDGTVDKQVYNAFGHLENGIIDYGGLDLTTTYSYDLNDNVLAVSDPAGTTNCFEYDALNRLVTEIKDCGGRNLTTNYSYDLAGNLLLRTDPQGVSYRHQYDTLGRENQLILDDGGLNIIGQYEHDSAGSLVGVTDDQGNVYTLEYDDLKRVTRICEDVTGPNLCTSYAYDELGNRATATDPNGITTFTTYNDFGLASEVVKDYGGMAAVTRYGYDNALNLAQIDDANGNKTNYVYTARNERSMEMYADGSTVNYSHDARGFVQDRTDQDGSTVSYQYDGAGRLMQREFSTGGNHSFTFDQAGRMTSAMETLVDRESLITVGLNSLGDVISTTESIDGQSWSVHYDYDYSGSVYTITYPSGAQRVYTLDPLKRISTVQNGAGIPIATYDYRDVDGYGTLAYANGTINRTDFDALGRITSITSDMGDYRYGYDAAGNRTYMKRAHLPGQPSDVYQYDDLYQLEQVWYGADATDPSAISNYESIQGYNLDMLRNRLEVNDNGNVEVYLPNDGYQLTNQMNRYEQVDDRVFAYDGRGNTLDDGLNTYSYDILNRQTSVSGPASNAEYIYNAAGWRIAKMVDGVTTYYAQDVNGQVLEERTADGNMSALYTYGLAIDQPLTMERDGSTYYYHRDAQGSITEVTDSGGNLVEQYTYDIYGAAKIYDGTGDPLSDSAIGNPYLYTARRYDPESSNYYFRARYYTPATGRFLQMDPVGYVDGMNLYASYFVLNSTDPSGLKFAVELFKGDIHGGLGGSLSVEVEFDFKDCCVGGTSIEDGERTYTLKIAATFGLGLGAAAKVVGTGVSLGVSGPELVGEGAFSAKNTECGGPVNTLEHCRSAGIDLGAKGNIGAIAYTFEVAYKVQGQLKLCGSIGTGKASIDLSFCGTLTLELNQQIGPLKLPIWKHKNSIEDQCISLVKRSWPLPE
ncbi:MAG TPA: RHS repeat-associated core domain-containing protein, partial [candidate division Zixibacteria bacterium]|nr:RHS repeat-associated core domain-containing protein [candidate division Zixibacteria bacterium]